MIATPVTAWLSCALTLLLLVVACDIETDLPPRAESIAVESPPAPNPAETPAPDETATPPPAPTQEPTSTPELTITPAPEPTYYAPTPHPEPTATAVATPATTPEPAPTPDSAITPAPEPTYYPTPHPEPSATAVATPATTPEPALTPELTITPAPEPTYYAPTPHPEPTATAVATPATTPEPALTPELTITPAPEPTPHPLPTRPPGDQVSSIDAPVPAGSTVVTSDGIALTILSFNPDAASVLANEDPYYEPPHEGNRFVMARFRAQNVGGDANNPIDMDNIIDRFYFVDSSSEIVGFWRLCGTADFRERHISLFPGGTAEGNICFEIPKSETDLVLMHDAHDRYAPIFLALANPDSVEPVRVVDAPADPPDGQAAGRSRSNPVPPGRYAESADGLTALTLVSVNMNADYDEYYQVTEGNRLVAARVRVQNIGGDVNSALIIEGGFTLVGSSDVEFYGGVSQGSALFLGGIVEVSVSFEIPESETDLVLIHTSPDPPRQPGRIRAPKLEEPRRWLAFANPDVVEAPRVVEASLEPLPGQLAGRFRSSPVPPGASAHNPWGMAISVVSANLDAAAEILTENPSNDPPAEGNRFVIARARIEWVGGNASDTTPVDIYPFNLVGSSAVGFSAIDNSCGAIPDEMRYAELSSGEAVELDVCFEIPESETGLVLFYGPPNEPSTRWMKMPEN